MASQQGAAGVLLRLGAVAGRLQAQLDGFKSRALRVATQERHLYVTEWHSLGEPVSPGDSAMLASGAAALVVCEEELSIECERLAARVARDKLTEKLRHASWAMVAAAAATQLGSFAVLPVFAIEVALALVLAVTTSAPELRVWILTVGAQAVQQCQQRSAAEPAAQHSHHAGLWGLARAARSETSLPLLCLDASVPLAFERCPPRGEPEAALKGTSWVVPRLATAPQVLEPSPQITRDSHLVSGGTGGLGLLTARWLSQRGTRRLILASRGGVLARDTAGGWGPLQSADVSTLVRRCDVAEVAHARWLVATSQGSPRITGVWHAAGVIADGLLPKQTAGSVAYVFAPKAHSAWILQSSFSLAPLRVCALFSSVAALLGSAGQANYSAANTCLDALAACRRGRSQVGVSVQWGAWAEVGMAARGAAGARMAALESSSGFGLIRLSQGLGALHSAVLPRASPNLAMVPVQWHRLLGEGAVPAFLTDLLPGQPRTPSVDCCVSAAMVRAAGALSIDAVLEMVQRIAGGGTVKADAPLMEVGIDSLGTVELRNQLQRAIGESSTLPSTLAFDHPTVRAIASLLAHSQPHSQPQCNSAASTPPKLSQSSTVAIAGIGFVLPVGIMKTADLCKMSLCGCDLLRVIPSARWDVEQAIQDISGFPPEVMGRVRNGAFLHSAELFKHSCFNISWAEAVATDPQQRQLLECGYTALHASGMRRSTLLGAVIAVNVGQWASEFSNIVMSSPTGRSVYATTGFSCSVTCGRVSFVLGLQGPCATYDTACSSSLVANHGSLRALQRAECTATLSAGVNMILDPVLMSGNAIAGYTSVRGRSHTFDARADGYARGEAIDAIACRLGDDITSDQALGSAVRQDGRSASLTAPNGQAQQGLLLAAHSDAQQLTEQAAALEAHGTGTALGDPIEAGSFAAVLLTHRSSTSPLTVNSLKANAGHTEPGAGLAGALTLLVKLRGVTSPNAHLRALNPHIGGTLRSARSCTLATLTGGLWMTEDTQDVSGGVSSFGFSGTIAHTVLRHFGHQAPQTPAPSLLLYRRCSFPWREATHPFVQRCHLSSSEAVTFRSPVAGSLLAIIKDHVVQGRIVFPGAGFLEMARAAAPTGSALRGVFFLQPLAVEVPELLIECALVGSHVEVRSGRVDASTDATVHCSGELSITGSWQRMDHMSLRARSCVCAAHVGSLYDSFDAAGLQYGPDYRTLVQLWGGTNDAAARLCARSRRDGTQVHPADLDDAQCAGAVIAPSGGGRETRLPFAVDDALLQGSTGELWAVRSSTARLAAPPLDAMHVMLPLGQLCYCMCRFLARRSLATEVPRRTL